MNPPPGLFASSLKSGRFCCIIRARGKVRNVLISTRGRYALRVLTDMAEHQSEGYIPLKEIAERQGISEKYLEGIVKLLVKDGILTGVRGKGGGYRLGESPDRFTAGRILRLTEGTLSPVACLEKGEAHCPRMADCRTLNLWKGLDRVIFEYLENYTLADLAEVCGKEEKSL